MGIYKNVRVLNVESVVWNRILYRSVAAHEKGRAEKRISRKRGRPAPSSQISIDSVSRRYGRSHNHMYKTTLTREY